MGLLVAASTVVALPAARADAQFWPGYPPMWGPGMGMGMGAAPMAAPVAAPTASPATSCQQAIAQAAYPMVNQMIQFTAAANVYPTGPFGRPFVGPSFGYPGVAGLYGAGLGGNLALANRFIASGRTTLGGFPPGAFPGAVANQLAGVPGGLVAVGGLGTGITADLIGLAGLAQAETANVLAGIDTRQGVLGTRFAAAELNAALTSFPREQAALLKEAIEGLTLYRDLACPPNGENGQANGNGNGNAERSASENGNGGNGNGNGERP
jgi:hypothetical protein